MNQNNHVTDIQKTELSISAVGRYLRFLSPTNCLKEDEDKRAFFFHPKLNLMEHRLIVVIFFNLFVKLHLVFFKHLLKQIRIATQKHALARCREELMIQRKTYWGVLCSSLILYITIAAHWVKSTNYLLTQQ